MKTSVGRMLGQRLRRWPSILPAVGQSTLYPKVSRGWLTKLTPCIVHRRSHLPNLTHQSFLMTVPNLENNYYNQREQPIQPMVRPPSTTLAQHQINIASTPCVFWKSSLYTHHRDSHCQHHVTKHQPFSCHNFDGFKLFCNMKKMTKNSSMIILYFSCF